MFSVKVYSLHCWCALIQSCGRLIARTKRAERYKITAEQRNNIALFWSDERVQACFSRLVEFDADFEAMR